MRPLRPALVLSIAASLALAGCGWMNPKNWFGIEEAKTLEPEGGYIVARADKRVPIAQLTDLRVEQSLTGAIVTATGLPPTQGWWKVALEPENDGRPVDGVVTYHLVGAWPDPGSADAQRSGSPESRYVRAAAYINTTRLNETTKIVVIAGENSKSVSSR